MLAVFAVFIAVVTVATYMSHMEEKDRALDMIKQQVLAQNNAAFDSLNMLMIDGSMENRETMRKKLLAEENVLDVRFLRGDGVKAQYGKGNKDEQVVDEIDKQALAGKKVVKLSEEGGVRALTVAIPFRATKNTRGVNCLACHEVPSGTVNGAIRMSVSLEPIYGTIERAFWKNMIISAGLFAVGLFLIYWLLKRIVIRPLQTVTQVAERIASGDMEHTVQSDSQDEIGNLFQSMERMQAGLLAKVTADKEALRIKTSLDQVGTPVQIADADYNIFYMNKAAEEMFRTHEDDFRNLVTDFDPGKVLGSNIDAFHKKPAHQRQLLDGLSESVTSDDLIFCDKFIMRVTATPVVNESGERVATVMEWLDRSAEVTAEREVADMVAAVQKGDLSVRLSAEGKTGFFAELAHSLNGVTDTIDQAVRDTISGLKALENGDLTHRITNDYEGAFDVIKQASNNTAEKLAEVVKGIADTAGEVGNGSSEIARGNAQLNNSTQEQAAAPGAGSGAGRDRSQH